MKRLDAAPEWAALAAHTLERVFGHPPAGLLRVYQLDEIDRWSDSCPF